MNPQNGTPDAVLGCIAITGADGFLGWHLRCFLRSVGLPEPRMVLEPDFESTEALARALGPADCILHLAGMNRGPDSEVYETNIRLAQRLVDALPGSRPPRVLLFANSTHSDNDSPFGRSKKEAARLLARWAAPQGTRFIDLILPHLFGEGGRPFYNSGFATFCHQLAHDEEPQIIRDTEVSLLHAQRVAEACLEACQDSQLGGQIRLPGTPMLVSEALRRLRDIHETYQAGVLPDLSDPLSLDFFNTYRSYLFPERVPVLLPLRTDVRGSLFEAVKTVHGGQAFLSTTHPGVTRGKHYHRRKVERFLVISGEAEVRVRKLLTDQVHRFKVTGEAPCYLDIPTLHTHDITNTGAGELLTLFWSHEMYDAAHPDTYPEPVILEP